MHSRSRKALGIAVASALALTVSACGREGGDGGDRGSGGEASPGITDDSVTLGISTPLSGATAGPGTCTVAGITAYFGMKNAEGGVEFGDGKTRTVEIEALDDTYDPQQAKANYDQLKDDVFAMTAGLGTPTNRAWRDAAIADEVPQALIMTGDPLFSDPEESPWQLGFVPIYQNEGEAFGELLASSGQQHRVAILSQNDDYGEGYVEGFKSAVEGADNIEIVEELTYEATDTSVDAQMTELAASDADVMFNAMSLVPLAVSALQKAQQLNWTPSWFLPSNTSSPGGVLTPGGATAFPGVYSVAFSKAPAGPAAGDPDVVEYLAALKQYGDYQDPPAFPHCQWSWMVGATLEQAFGEMTEPTRENFMEALRGISGFEAPLMLPDTSVDTTEAGQPAVSTVVVQKYNGKGYDTVTTFE
ncbi:ABC-type branched-subunit amino acid transport system substrate-binding protein [Modestobacter versicolor]|uniref:ABC-type branched-subunit amino acid transport system substrate-binding protein n=2 Tax=Modestobacter versicolor TaxID=429133 RepID=A0A323V9T2_9ACTN|nr:ABC-type branched-subunit amino acid transport system substrate-binding protein [Modestobacter versicolor]PZA21592.1 amino acid-binding protein [Modestobacter versicolor]